MARIRSIKPEFWVSEQVAECSPSARLTFIGMWTFSDDNGVHPAKPKTLKAELYPMDDISSTEVSEHVEELIRVGLVAVFEADGQSFWRVTGWAKHQKIDRPSYKYPAPPHQSASVTDRPNFGELSANAPRETKPEQPSAQLTLDEDSSSIRRAPSPGVEGSGKERKGGGDSTKSRRRSPVAQEGIERPVGVDGQVWDDWLRLRRQKRATVTKTVIEEAIKDAATAGLSLEEFLRVWCKRGSQGLDPAWLKPHERSGASGPVRSALHADNMIGEDT